MKRSFHKTFLSLFGYFSLVKEIKYLAYHDLLTGLLNRNWLYKNIDNISAKYVYFIDINDLHVINKDGHTFGDEHIREVIKSIELRRGDILIRYAGDEFVLFSDRINAVVTNRNASVGICEIKGDILTSINHADSDMLHSKLMWKNKK
jgi:GGDEF domain-containing protein